MKKLILALIVVVFVLGCASVNKEEVAKAYVVKELTEAMLQDTGYYSLMSIITELETLEKQKANNKITDVEYKIKQEALIKALDKFSKDKKDKK